jgi:hypothetical protein
MNAKYPTCIVGSGNNKTRRTEHVAHIGMILNKIVLGNLKIRDQLGNLAIDIVEKCYIDTA